MSVVDMGYLEAINPNNRNCPVSGIMNGIYRSHAYEKETQLPENVGKGYCRKVIIQPSLEILIHDMTFLGNNIMSGSGKSGNDIYTIFCLGNDFKWQLNETGKEYEIKSGENYIADATGMDCSTNFYEGQRCFQLSVKMSRGFLPELFDNIDIESLIDGKLRNADHFNKNKTTVSLKRILFDIINCRYSGRIRQIYMEAKIVELLAVYTDEIVFEDSVVHASTGFSREDMDGLRRAKDIIDADIANAPSLHELAGLVYLNDFKLKTGFKELFGMPVHAYIIDKRLERAYCLLEDGKCRVSDVAQLVGYNHLGQFAEKFKKKYGITPSECLKN